MTESQESSKGETDRDRPEVLLSGFPLTTPNYRLALGQSYDGALHIPRGIHVYSAYEMICGTSAILFHGRNSLLSLTFCFP